MKKSLKIIMGMLMSAVMVSSTITLQSLPETADASTIPASKSNYTDTGNEPDNYAYSFMVVGDTQIVNCYDDDDKFLTIYDYIVDNVESKKVKHVFGLGDITDKDTDAEWALAKKGITKMDGVVPYSIVRGNHDLKTGYDETFGLSSTYANQFIDYYEGAYGGETRNTVHEFSAGQLDYLVIALDYGASDEVLAWASEVVEAHPHHNVIVTTHAYLYRDGTTLDSGDSTPPSTTGGYNNGDHMWDKFIKKYKNIVLVLSGHDVCNDIEITQTAGVHGNIVTQMLINPQTIDSNIGSSGMVANLYFSADGKTVNVEWYSTINKKYYNAIDKDFAGGVGTLHTVKKDSSYVKTVVKGGGGSITPAYQNFTTGDSINITITPDTYYVLSKITQNGVDVTDKVKNGKYAFTATEASYSIVVEFKSLQKYWYVEENELYKGRIVYSDNKFGCMFVEETSFQFKIIPKENYTVEKVTLNGTELIADSNGYYTVVIQPRNNILFVEYEN